MPVSHLFLALAVVFVWGTNFVVIRWGLDGLPPFLFATLRFALSALPWVLVVRWPRTADGARVSWRPLALFGLLLGAGQFGLLFLAIRSDISPGLASLVIQMQVFFTIGLSMLLMHEPVRRFQLVGLALAVAGLAVIGLHLDAHITARGVALVLAAGFFWSCANMVVKHVGRVQTFNFVVWSSLFGVPPLLLITLAAEGPALVAHSLQHATPLVWGSVVWQAVGNSLFGYGVWSWLIARHPAATITPMALLVPIFGFSASALALGEPLQPWKLHAALLVMAGLAVNVLWPYVAMRWRRA
ncbi:MAG: EamA family transporter [Betaproteobacteria bacterium]|nr:EamA family transporter [Betaproteobacteria bacterium]